MSASELVSPFTSYPLLASVRVRTYELDSFGHVNNAVYLNYMEEARSEFLKQMGLSFHDFARLAVQIVIVESYVKYLAPSRYGDTIQVLGRIRDVRPVSAVFEYLLQRESDAQSVAEGWTRGAFVNAATGRPTRAPLEFLTGFRAAASDLPEGEGNAD